MGTRRRIEIALLSLLAWACAPIESSGTASGVAYEPDYWRGPPTRAVDLLLMVDTSCSMTEEQASLMTELPRVLEVLTTGDRDGDRVQDFDPLTSIHIGVVDADMGLGDVTGIATCDPGFGDDGLMSVRAHYPGTGCQTDYTSIYGHAFFAFDPTSPRSTTQVGTDVGCVAALGTAGCGFEHQLESPLKAVSLRPNLDGSSPVDWTRDGYRPPVFYAGTLGHGDDAATNGGFLRADSVLAIVLLSDEDDCSTPNPRIFAPDDPAYNTVDLNLRCHTYASELYPVQRYVDGFAGLRRDPHRLVYAAIVGVPPEVAGEPPEVILADPNMTETINPAMTNQLLPSCVSPGGRGVGYPAVRMTAVAQGLRALGAHTTVQTICNTNFSAAFDEILREITEAAR